MTGLINRLQQQLYAIESALAECDESLREARAELQKTDQHPVVAADVQRLEFHHDELTRQQASLQLRINQANDSGEGSGG